MRILFNIVTIVAAASAITACRIDTAAPQMQYSATRDSCQELAELKVDWYAQQNPELQEGKLRNAKLVETFTDCMSNNSWDVGRPKEAEKPKEKVVEKPVPTHLTNRGVGVGVGPTYALEPKPVTTESAFKPLPPSNIEEPSGFEPQVPPVTTAPRQSTASELSAPPPTPVEENLAAPAPSTLAPNEASPQTAPAAKRNTASSLNPQDEKIKQMLEEDTK